MLVALVGATFAASVALVGARGMVGLVGARQFFLALVGAGRSLFARVWLALKRLHVHIHGASFASDEAVGRRAPRTGLGARREER